MTGPSTVAVITSRLRRLVVPDEPWVAGLRGLLRQIKSDGGKLFVGQGTAGAEFIRRGAERLGIQCLCAEYDSQVAEADTELPWRDRVVVDAADLIYVLTLRTGGNQHQLLRQRLMKNGGQVVLVDIPGLQAEAARKELLESGAQIWRPDPQQCRPFDRIDGSTDDNGDAMNLAIINVFEVVPFPDAGHWDLLTHTTRSCPGPWPGESFESYADCLFESNAGADHSAFAALRRIVQQRRLIASDRTIRGEHRVVSLTARALADLPSLHQFRSHRTRWDFEPFGICIRRDWLRNRGARPAIYGDNANWQAMSETDRPFFQLAGEDSVIDWSVEQEWRHVGDLDLTALPADDAFLFVPNFEAAKSLSSISLWPVTLWPDCENMIP